LIFRAHLNVAYKPAVLPLLASVALAASATLSSAQVSLTTVVELAQQHSPDVRLAQANVQKTAAQLAQSRDAFIPSVTFGSGLPAFPEIGFTGSLPSIWDSQVGSMIFSLPQAQYIRAARTALDAAQLSLKDAREQVALDASTTYLELDSVQSELAAARQQEQSANRLVEIEQQRAEAGVDPLSDYLQAQLTAAQIKLARIHLGTRAATLSKQLATLTGMPVGSITPDHASIPEIPAVSADARPVTPTSVVAAQTLAHSREQLAKGDWEHLWHIPQIAFGLTYNRNTGVLNSIDDYYKKPLPANNLSSGFSIQIPLFDASQRDKARESSADALKARVEAEQAQRQNELQIAELTGSLRELDTQAEIASLKQQIAGEQLKAVQAQLELGNGATSTPSAPPQLSPKAEQQALIDERQKAIDAQEAALELEKARLSLLRALGHMQDWLKELHTK